MHIAQLVAVRTSLEVRATSLGCKLFIDNATRNDEKRASRIAQFYMRIRHGYIRHVASWYHLYCIRHTGKMEFNIDSSNLYSLCRLSRNLFQILTSFQSKLSQCTNKVKDESRDNSRHFVQVYFSLSLSLSLSQDSNRWKPNAFNHRESLIYESLFYSVHTVSRIDLAYNVTK
jgi:hypothetical protein